MERSEPVDHEFDAPAQSEATRREPVRRIAAKLPFATMYQQVLTEELPASMLALIEQLR